MRFALCLIYILHNILIWGYILTKVRNCSILHKACFKELKDESCDLQLMLMDVRSGSTICTHFSMWHLPPGLGSPRHAQQWLWVKARTIRRTSPEGCVTFWRTIRWPTQSNEPESTRCHSTNSHPPVGSTAPYLGQVQWHTKVSQSRDFFFSPHPHLTCLWAL